MVNTLAPRGNSLRKSLVSGASAQGKEASSNQSKESEKKNS
jgi:hypothetical protein